MELSFVEILFRREQRMSKSEFGVCSDQPRTTQDVSQRSTYLDRCILDVTEKKPTVISSRIAQGRVAHSNISIMILR